MKTEITILVVMFVSITILLIIAYTLKSGEKYTDLPPREYQESCHNMSVTGNTLSGMCLADRKTTVPASINIPCTNGFTIINDMGVLKCVPPGNYSKSCADIRILENNTLWANCPVGYANLDNYSSVTIPCPTGFTVQNIDGQLTCK